MKAALDAGHGSNTGAQANGLIEDEVALDMVARIGHHLRAAGRKTVLTRPGTELVGINERAKKAVAENADVFLSIHCNAGPPAAEGCEAFIAAPDNRSVGLAMRILGAAIHGSGMHSRGVKPDNQSQHSSLGVLRGTYKKMPAVLLELGFLTNKADAKLLKDPFVREAVAKEIAGVLSK